MHQKAFLVLLFLCMLMRVNGQQYRVLHWGIENGLSQGINQKVVRDSTGFLWISSY